MDYKILTQDDLLELFPFGKTKLKCLLEAGVLPVVKVGRVNLTGGLKQIKGKRYFTD